MTAINKIGGKSRSFILLIIFIGFSACSGYQIQSKVDPPADRSTLDIWLEETLIPYLVRQLSQHPRFKGQPVMLVGMRGEVVRPRVDDLTREIRGKIIDALLKRPGPDLAWQAAAPPREHHPGFEDVPCGNYRKVQYYIGLDCGLTRLEGKLYVKVRALNLAEKKWVAGFGKSWEGWPTAAQRTALAEVQPDEYLRGQRPLPFSEEQPDLLAAYLARNLTCLLRQTASDDLVVHVANPSVNTPAFFKTTLELVGKYLARLREIEVTDNPSQANVSLVIEIHAIHQGLHQIWASVRYRHDEKYLPGAESEAYVWLDADEPTRVASSQGERPDAPLPVVQRELNSSEIIASFDLLTPLNQNSCITGTKRRSDLRRIEPHDRLSTGSCLAMEINLATPAYVFLVGQDADGELTQMFPSSCADFENKDTLLHPGQRFQFPSLSDPKTGVLELAGSSGMERVFAIAMTSRVLANGFTERLKDIRGLCRPGQEYSDALIPGYSRYADERIYRWQNYLSRLSADNPGLVQWQEISFWHEPK